MCTRSFVLFLFSYFWRPRDAQGRSKPGPSSPKGATRTPQGIPGTPQNRLKISLGYHLVTQGRPGGSRGTRRKEIDTKIYKKTLLAQHPQSVNKFAGVTFSTCLANTHAPLRPPPYSKKSVTVSGVRLHSIFVLPIHSYICMC